MKSAATLVFTDDACSGNPGPGGWGALIVTPGGEVTELGGHEPETTNNRMERPPGPLHIHTDSTHVIQGITRMDGSLFAGCATPTGTPGNSCS